MTITPAPALTGSGPATVAPRSSVHREPVTGSDDRTWAYTVTIVLREETSSAAEVRDQLLHEQYLALDLAGLVADRDVFVPAVGPMLDGFVPTPPSDSRLVLDLPAGFELRPDADRRASVLSSLEVGLALDGFVATPQQVALLGELDYVTVDPVALGANLSSVVRIAHDAGVGVLATNVVDVDLQTACLVAGVDALRGGVAERQESRAAERPKVLRPGQLQCLAALHLLHQADVKMSEVAEVIDTDPVLTLRVLHLVNSGAFSLRTQIDTVQRAVVLLGVREVTALVAALAVDARTGAMDSLWQILARALTCEALADDPAAYTVGMLSALVAELGVPADVVLEKVGVSPVVADAVRDQTGDLGAVLRAVVAHESGDPDAVSDAGYTAADVSDVYLRCLTDALHTAKAVDC